nr:outer membrane beta-barrel protein [Devosia insulae]
MGSASFAEDLVAAPVDQWAGFYVGAHGGYGVANRNGCGDIGVSILDWSIWTPDEIDSCDGVDEVLTYDYNQSGVLLGLQAGYNWTPAENFLAGVEVSLSGGGLSGELDGVFGGVGTWEGLATATAKAGFTHDRFLVYGEAGFGFAKVDFEGDLNCQFDAYHGAAVAGGGVSFKITDDASIDLKYNHVWLGAAQASCTSQIWDNSDFLTVPTEIRAQGSMDVVKLGLNFQIGN